MQPGDHVQRSIDARRNSSGDDNSAVIDDSFEPPNLALGRNLVQKGDGFVMGRGAKAIEKTCLRQEERTRANGKNDLASRCRLPKPIEQSWIGELVANPPAARDDQDIGRRAIVKGILRIQTQTVPCPDGPRRLRTSEHVKGRFFIRQLGGRKNLKRTRKIQDFDIIE
jgi:hypothetical protein